MKLKLATACLLAALVQAPHALATTGTITYTGIVSNTATYTYDGVTTVQTAPDYDVADLFGGGNLDGDFVFATFTYSSANAIEQYDNGVYDELDGGSSYPTGSPLISATFTVEQPTTLDLYSYTFTPDYYSDAYTSASYIDDIAYSAADNNFEGGNDIYAYIIPGFDDGPTNLAQSYEGGGSGVGSYFLPSSTNTGELDSIVFNTIGVSVVAAAPEPSTWALMIAGLGAAGLGLRYRRSRKVEGANLAV
jgi:hypothetical protein